MIWRLVSALLLCLAIAPGAASAHAIIIDSTPTANATVTGPNLNITLRFNSRIDRARSSLALTPADAKPLSLIIESSGTPDILQARASGLTPGTYNLRWQVLSVDGHITRGDIPFKIGF
jgi:methionine-rich copper-binding protein CopC